MKNILLKISNWVEFSKIIVNTSKQCKILLIFQNNIRIKKIINYIYLFGVSINYKWKVKLNVDQKNN